MTEQQRIDEAIISGEIPRHPDPRCVTRKGLSIVVAVMMVVSFSLAGMGIALSNARQRESDRRLTAQQQESERKFCSLIMQSQARAHRQAEAFRSAPPDTDAGRKQREELTTALGSIDKLVRDLGCPPEQKD
jgi:hypothetical protein